MRRLGILLVLAATPLFVAGAVHEAQGCKLLDKLLHRCRVCHHCGGYKCHHRKCDRPKCHCGHGHVSHHHGLWGPRHHHGHYYHGKQHGYYGGFRAAPPVYGQPMYVEPGYSEPAPAERVIPQEEEIPPAGRDF